MSMVDDTRKLLQDLVVPDLKALSARVEGIEKALGIHSGHIGARIDSLGTRVDVVGAKVDALEKSLTIRIDQTERALIDRLDAQANAAADALKAAKADLEKLFSARIDGVQQSLESTEKLNLARFEGMRIQMDANQAAILNAIDLSRRVARTEEFLPAPGRTLP